VPNIPRSLPALLASFPDNTAGLITPQNVRDLVVSGPIRGPGDWTYRLDSSATTGKFTWDSLTGELQINVIDFDFIDRTAALGVLLAQGASIRLIDTNNAGYLLLAVLSASFTSGIWTVQTETLLDASSFVAGVLVAIELDRADLVSPTGTLLSVVNAEGSAIVAGQPCYLDILAGGVLLANAASSPKPADGLVLADIPSGFLGTMQTDGILLLFDWTAAVGSTTLVAGSNYFLSDSSAGMLSETAPTAGGAVVQLIGKALDAVRLRLIPSAPLLL
jgi:hypothetical protein